VSNLLGDSEQENELAEFLSDYTSGVRLAQGKSHTVRELLRLPRIIRSIVDPQAALDDKIKEQGSRLLGKMFGPRRGTLKDYERIYVFVFGGIAFSELREIRQICAKGNQKIAITVVSDTICSAMSVLPDFSV
jgi:hypothetical protein